MIEDKKYLHRLIKESVREEEVLGLLSRLLALQSDTEGDQEYAVGQELVRYAEENGLEYTIQHVQDKRSNIILRYPGESCGKTLLYCGHLDVVPAGNLDLWVSPPYEPSIREGKMYGRGAADMKGSIAAALSAVNVIKRAGIRLKGDLVFALVIDEETQNLGMDTFLASSGVKADACLVGEPSSLDINLGHKGVIGLWVTFHGRRAHASMPEKGANPLVHCADLINRINRFQSEVLDGMDHPIFGRPTLTVTMVQGGKELNSIPEVAEMRLDRRYLRSESEQDCVDQVRAMIDAIREKDPEVCVDLRVTTVCPPAEISAKDPFIEIISKAICPEDPQSVKRISFGAGSEMGMIMDGMTIPAAIFGPGNLRQAHTINEWIEIDQLTKGTEIFARIYLEYLDQFKKE